MSDAPIQPERRPPLPYPGEPHHDPFNPPPPADPHAAKKRLVVPGIFVILIGLMNLLPGGCCTAIGVMMSDVPDSQLEAAARQHDARQWEEAQKEGYTVQSLKNIYLYSGLTVGGVSLLLTLVALVGGGCMIAGKSLFLCSMGALAAILSPGGFGLLGLAVGIWAFAVILNEDVRAAFRVP
jgi:hypothetical protein